jgi:hypothetical protein
MNVFCLFCFLGFARRIFYPATIFRKAPPSVASGYGKRSINLNKVVANFENHTFLSQTDLPRTRIISNRQKLCKRAQKISAAAPLRVMASRYNPCE